MKFNLKHLLLFLTLCSTAGGFYSLGRWREREYLLKNCIKDINNIRGWVRDTNSNQINKMRFLALEKFATDIHNKVEANNRK